MLSNCGAGEDSWESLGQQGDQTSQSQRKSTLNIHWKDCCWSSSTLVTWCKELTHWKRLWCWERLRAGRKGRTEDKKVEWQHQLKGHEFEQTLGYCEGQGSLACYSPWGHEESNMTERPSLSLSLGLQFRSISSSALSLLYGTTLTSIPLWGTVEKNSGMGFPWWSSG